MTEQRPNIINLLEKEKGYYAEQIRRINVALTALKGEEKAEQEKESKQPRKVVQWKKEVSKVFKEYDELTLNEVCDKLVEKGISEALDKKYKNTILSTLRRMQIKGKLEKIGKRYQKKSRASTLLKRMEIDEE